MSSYIQILAMQRIAKLVDENSFMEIGSLVTARSTDFNLTAAKAPSDGVIIGHGLNDGNLVFISCFQEDNIYAYCDLLD